MKYCLATIFVICLSISAIGQTILMGDTLVSRYLVPIVEEINIMELEVHDIQDKKGKLMINAAGQVDIQVFLEGEKIYGIRTQHKSTKGSYVSSWYYKEGMPIYVKQDFSYFKGKTPQSPIPKPDGKPGWISEYFILENEVKLHKHLNRIDVQSDVKSIYKQAVKLLKLASKN